ncbi:hypothetical protein GFS24_20700 [Chitinophaga sp. SYP-B3965]|uniref:hypothetical protein n=1 Tax=Chitinophaga sp. SYP-B3965 TaxID=2663120 RepID=UPI0012996AEB|nr:hypothetical protein [Chitinophaga sp. SYP-B3965]MRG47554.1 hypothetical protein [Chitinophaga sp. SYP-B3965]
MTKVISLLSALFMLFWAVPFPMIMYYSINSEYDVRGLTDKDPWLALGIVATTIILWLILLAGYFHKWVLFNFIAKRNIERLKEHGVPRTAEILDVSKISKDGATHDTYELKLSFKNLVNTEIIQKTSVNDAKPHEHRFEAGKKIDILIDKDMKSIPYFIFATSEASINKTRLALIILGWLALTAVIIGYYIFSYNLESNGAGWRFMSFGHPLFICPVVLFGYRLLGMLILSFTGKPDDAAYIKFKGIRTNAKLIKVGQTGTYINEQPMVRFEMEFLDEHQQKHKASFKKLVDLLNLDITKQETLDIFYLPENPQRIAFTSDLDEIS